MQTPAHQLIHQFPAAVFSATLLGVLLGFGVFFDYLAREDVTTADLAREVMCFRPNEIGLGEPSAICEQLAQAKVRP